MFSTILTFVITALVGSFMALVTGYPGFGAIFAVATAGAIIVYNLNRLCKTLVPEKEPTFDNKIEENAVADEIEEVPEEETYGVNDLYDTNEENSKK